MPRALLQRHLEKLYQLSQSSDWVFPRPHTFSTQYEAHHSKDRHPHPSCEPHDSRRIALPVQLVRCYDNGIMTVPSLPHCRALVSFRRDDRILKIEVSKSHGRKCRSIFRPSASLSTATLSTVYPRGYLQVRCNDWLAGRGWTKGRQAVISSN